MRGEGGMSTSISFASAWIPAGAGMTVEAQVNEASTASMRALLHHRRTTPVPFAFTDNARCCVFFGWRCARRGNEFTANLQTVIPAKAGIHSEQ